MAVGTKSRPARLRRELHMFAPQVATRVGDGLTRTLGLPTLGADRTPATVAEEPPAAV
jgi:hypothetical protein